MAIKVLKNPVTSYMASNKLFMDLLEEIDSAIKSDSPIHDQENNSSRHNINNQEVDNNENNHNQSNNITSSFKENISNNPINNQFINKNFSDKIENMSTNASYSEENTILKNIMGNVIRQWLNQEGKVIIEEFFKVHILRCLESPSVIANIIDKQCLENVQSKMVNEYLSNGKSLENLNNQIGALLKQETKELIKPLLQNKIDNLLNKMVNSIVSND